MHKAANDAVPLTASTNANANANDSGRGMVSVPVICEQLAQLVDLLRRYETVVVGAGSGLSTAAGYVYDGERFTKHFSDFAEKYGIEDMYSGGFYPFPTREEYWAFWSRCIKLNRFDPMPTDLYSKLHALLQDKDYFVLTTNVDHCFQRSGFDRERLFYTQGDYGRLQCQTPCRKETFDCEKMILEMVEQQRDCKVPTSLLPRCPHCGEPLVPHLRSDDRFVEDQGWIQAAVCFSRFLNKIEYEQRPVLFLELGVGFNTPSIIKYRFWKLTHDNPNAYYVCINADYDVVPEELEGQSLAIKADLKLVIEALSICLKTVPHSANCTQGYTLIS